MIRMFQKFFSMNAAPGILLGIAAILAMVMQNSPLHGFYDSFKDVPVVFQIGTFSIDKHLLHWINDGLMAVFFLLVGLEIKREVLEGHLSSRVQFTLPAVAALGGVIAPALVYAFVTGFDPEYLHGWAIPTATDIAFALGILILLGDRIPMSLKVTLVAIAIIDDLAAIIIIALFYTSDISLISLGGAFVGIMALFALNRMGVSKLSPYVVIGLVIWAFVLKSGVHATLAGVAIGLLIPLYIKNEDGKSPLKIMEHALHPWVAFLILPIFAFVNAGVSLSGISLETFMQPITLGIILGLFVGKQIGVMGLTYIASRFNICQLSPGVTGMHFYGMALLTGVGFTMSLFIGTLAFSNVEYAAAVRIGVLTGSILSGGLGVIVLLIASRKPVEKPVEA
jgi:NhaA family Na+:H+ antiporter